MVKKSNKTINYKISRYTRNDKDNLFGGALLYICSLCLPLIFSLLSACSNDASVLSSWEHSLSGLYAVEISNDGRFAVVSSFAEGTRYWDLDNNSFLYQWSHGESPDSDISSVAISPNGSHVITADNRTFVVWETTTGNSTGYWQVDADIMDVAISNDGSYVLLGLKDGRAMHINQNTQRRLEVVAHREERVTTVDLSADGLLAVTGGDDARVMVWSSVTGKETNIFEHKTRISLVKLDQKNRQLMSSDEKGHAYIWDLRSGNKTATLKLKRRQNIISSARFSSNGENLLTGFPGRDIMLWDRKSGKLINKWQAPNRKKGWIPQSATVYSVAFADRGKSIVAEASSGLGQRWSLGN